MLTKKPLQKPLTLTANMQNSPVVVDSMVIVKLNSSQWIQTLKKHSNLNPLLSAVLFLRNISQPLAKVSKKHAKAGILGGFPVLGVHATVYDGSYHEVDSSEMAFHIAGSLAFKDAMKKGNPVLLEPIMKVEVTMPEEYMGDVIGDINSRRGRIEGMEDIGGGKMVKAYVPLAEMFGYSTDLRSKTQGRGNYSMFFERYEQVPKSVQEKVLNAKEK